MIIIRSEIILIPVMIMIRMITILMNKKQNNNNDMNYNYYINHVMSIKKKVNTLPCVNHSGGLAASVYEIDNT